MVSQRFTHPFTLSLEDWTSILAELHVQRQAEGLLDPVPEGPVMAAFTEEEVRYLSVTLSKAFAQAQPHEWVVFGLSRATPRGLTELTTGGGYVAGPSLHVALVNYRKIVTMPRTRQLLWKRPLRPDDAAPAADRQRIDGGGNRPDDVLGTALGADDELQRALGDLGLWSGGLDDHGAARLAGPQHLGGRSLRIGVGELHGIAAPMRRVRPTGSSSN